MVRRLPVIQNTVAAPADARLGVGWGAVALVVVGALSWVALLWAVARLGWWAISLSGFAACVLAASIVGSQVVPARRQRTFALAAGGFALVFSSTALLGGTLPNPLVFAASFVTLGALSASGFFVGGWFLTLRR